MIRFRRTRKSMQRFNSSPGAQLGSRCASLWRSAKALAAAARRAGDESTAAKAEMLVAQLSLMAPRLPRKGQLVGRRVAPGSGGAYAGQFLGRRPKRAPLSRARLLQRRGWAVGTKRFVGPKGLPPSMFGGRPRRPAKFAKQPGRAFFRKPTKAKFAPRGARPQGVVFLERRPARFVGGKLRRRYPGALRPGAWSF